MPSLKDHQSAHTTKLLLLGDSGAGKSGALASLADAGYNLRIVDLDNGLDVLANILRDSASKYKPEALGRVEFETLTDPLKNINGKLVAFKADAWERTIKLLTHWGPKATGNEATPDLGPITTWTPKDVLVIDSLTLLAQAALNFVLKLNTRLGQPPHQSDWYAGQQLLESLLGMLYDVGVQCNVIINCHITYIGDDNTPMARGYPSALGKALPPKVGRYFNNMVLCRTTGSGANVKHKILTNSTTLLELKTSAPTRVKAEYGIEFGLAELFRDLQGSSK